MTDEDTKDPKPIKSQAPGTGTEPPIPSLGSRVLGIFLNTFFHQQKLVESTREQKVCKLGIGDSHLWVFLGKGIRSRG